MNIKRNYRATVLFAAVAATSLNAFAAATISEDTVASSSATYNEELRIDANLTVPSNVTLTMANGTSAYLPYSAGKDTTLRTTGGTFKFYDWQIAAQHNDLILGANGGKGHIVVDAGDFMVNSAVISRNAEADASGYVDFATINGRFLRGAFYVMSVSPARIKFSGGGMIPPHTTSLRDFFSIGEGSELVLFADNHEISFNLNPGLSLDFRLNAGSGKFTTGGTGNMRFYANGGASKVRFCAGEDRATWGHSGDTVFDGPVNVILEQNQSLPHGDDTGIVKFTSSQAGTMSRQTDLNGFTSAVNGIWADANAISHALITNSSASAEGVLQFGVRNEDSSIVAPPIRGNCAIEKLGTGTLSITNLVVQKMRVLGGTAKVVGASVSAESIVVSNATLVVDGVTLAAQSIVCIDGGDVTFANGGAVSAGCEVRRSLDTANYPSKWTAFGIKDYGYVDPFGAGTSVDIVKRNSDTFTYYQAAPTIGDIDIREGTLRFGGEPCTLHYPWWRLTIRKSAGSVSRTAAGVSETMHAGLGRWWVVTPELTDRRGSGNWSGPSLMPFGQSLVAGTPTADLGESKWTAAKPWVVASGADSIAQSMTWTLPDTLGRLFNNGNYEYYLSTVFANVAPNPTDSASWESVAFRFGSAQAAAYTIGGYLLSIPVGIPGISPVSWTVETSPDGNNWTEVDVRDDVDPADLSGYWMNGGKMFLFNANAASWTFSPTGMVKVAAGATLDLSEIPTENIAIRGLEVDVENGGGSITKFVPSPDGLLSLDNVPAESLDANGLIASPLVLPVSIETVSGADNLASWSVVANGVPQNGAKVLLTSGGAIKVSRTFPTTVVFR